MFAKLTGVVDDLAEDHLVLDVHGVGYLVFATTKTLATLAIGDSVALKIDTQVGEDHFRLFGFKSADEQRWFRLLQSVQGVGARVALAILSTLPPDMLSAAIAAQDKASVARANGVGPKLALRIITELKDKALVVTIGGTATDMQKSARTSPMGQSGDAMSALTNLGYTLGQAHDAVAKAQLKLGDSANLAVLIRQALKEAAA